MLLNSNVLFDPSLDAYSERFGFRLSPNEEQIVEKPEYRHTARTNSLGFRTKEIAPRGANELRVLLLGDPFFYGTGVEEEDMISTWLERLNAEDDSAQYSLIAYNFAVFGYNTVQQLIVAREFVQDIGPHEIVLGLFIGNDILPNAIAYIDGEGNYAVSEERLTRMRNELHSYYPPLLGASVIYRMMARLAVVPRLRYKMASRPEILEETYSLLEELGSLSLANESGFSVVIIYPRDGTAGGFMQRWTRSRVVGNRIRVFCEQNDIRGIDHSPHRRGSPPRSSEAESLLPRCSEPVAHGSVPAGRQALPCPGCFRDGDRAPARPCERIALPPTPSLRRRATRERALDQGGPTNGSSLPWRPARVPRNPRASPSDLTQTTRLLAFLDRT